MNGLEENASRLPAALDREPTHLVEARDVIGHANRVPGETPWRYRLALGPAQRASSRPARFVAEANT